MAMCNRMPQKQPQLIGLATRMKNMNPVVQNMPTVELVVSNEMVKNEIEAILGSVLATLKTYLHNSQVKLTLRVDEQHEQAKPLSRHEQLEEMMKQNEAIDMLCQEFDLELA